MKPRKPLNRISAKKLAQLNGNVPFSTVTGPIGPTRKPKPRKPIKSKNAKRAKANHDRAYGTAADIEAVNNEPCVHCGKWPSANAHIKNGGMSRKADAKWKLPLCTIRDGKNGCHETFDQGKESFRAAYAAAHGETMDQTAERRAIRSDRAPFLDPSLTAAGLAVKGAVK